MNPADYPTAWDHPATRRAWAGHMAMNIIGLVGWPAVWVGMLYLLIGFLSQGFIFLFVVPLCYAFYRAVIQLLYFPPAFHMLRVLQAYPWQVLSNVPKGLDEHPEAEGNGIWIELPHPVGPLKKGIPLTFVSHHRSSWWLRHIGGPRTKPERKAKLEPLWFAGDPRFIGVVAAPSKNAGAPRRLHFLYQPSAFTKGAARKQWDDVGPSDIERARRAGARFLGVVPSAR